MTRHASALALPSLFDETPAPVSAPTHSVTVRAHRRTIRGEPGPSGRQLRDAALALHQTRSGVPEALAYVRAQLVERYHERVHYWPHKPESHHVTAEDADEILTAWADCPADVLARPTQKWRGAIFNPRGWIKIAGRRVTSERAGQHANDLACWMPREGV